MPQTQRELTALPRPLAVLKGGYTSKGKGWWGGKGIAPPPASVIINRRKVSAKLRMLRGNRHTEIKTKPTY